MDWNVGMEVEYLGLNWKQGKELIVKIEGRARGQGRRLKYKLTSGLRSLGRIQQIGIRRK